jgi:hypothetical protein
MFQQICCSSYNIWDMWWPMPISYYRFIVSFSKRYEILSCTFQRNSMYITVLTFDGQYILSVKHVTYERCKHCWFTTQRRFIKCYKVKLLIKIDWKINDPHIENTFLNIMGILVWKRVVLNFPKSFPVVELDKCHRFNCLWTWWTKNEERIYYRRFNKKRDLDGLVDR